MNAIAGSEHSANSWHYQVLHLCTLPAIEFAPPGEHDGRGLHHPHKPLQPAGPVLQVFCNNIVPVSSCPGTVELSRSATRAALVGGTRHGCTVLCLSEIKKSVMGALYSPYLKKWNFACLKGRKFITSNEYTVVCRSERKISYEKCLVFCALPVWKKEL